MQNVIEKEVEEVEKRKHRSTHEKGATQENSNSHFAVSNGFSLSPFLFRFFCPSSIFLSVLIGTGMKLRQKEETKRRRRKKKKKKKLWKTIRQIYKKNLEAVVGSMKEEGRCVWERDREEEEEEERLEAAASTPVSVHLSARISFFSLLNPLFALLSVSSMFRFPASSRRLSSPLFLSISSRSRNGFSYYLCLLLCYLSSSYIFL